MIKELGVWRVVLVKVKTSRNLRCADGAVISKMFRLKTKARENGCLPADALQRYPKAHPTHTPIGLNSDSYQAWAFQAIRISLEIEVCVKNRQ